MRDREEAKPIMINRIITSGGILIFASLLMSIGTLAYAQSPVDTTTTSQTHTEMTTIASGTFDVKLIPQAPEEASEDSGMGRMTIDKQFFSDLDAHSVGQMLTAMTATEGSAGYDAIEHVSGTLHERVGTFVLQHNATMAHGAQQQSVSVVPDSGTGELVGLSGEMKITISDGKHFYEFTYTLDSDS